MRVFNRSSDRGFTFVELAVTVLIIGILVSIAVPLFRRAQDLSRQRACFSNQRSIEGAAHIWSAQTGGNMTLLAGEVSGTHLLVGVFLKRPPRCPAAPAPADPMNPDAAHGAYTLDGSGTVQDCAFASHGYYAAH